MDGGKPENNTLQRWYHNTIGYRFNTWENLTTPGYCWYNNDSVSYRNTYGALYNWYAVNTGKLAPTGWHVPSDAEWEVLGNYLGGDSVAGGKLKEAGNGALGFSQHGCY